MRYLVSYSSPNQRALQMMPRTRSCEIEGFYIVAMMFVTDL